MKLFNSNKYSDWASGFPLILVNTGNIGQYYSASRLKGSILPLSLLLSTSFLLDEWIIYYTESTGTALTCGAGSMPYLFPIPWGLRLPVPCDEIAGNEPVCPARAWWVSASLASGTRRERNPTACFSVLAWASGSDRGSGLWIPSWDSWRGIQCKRAVCFSVFAIGPLCSQL